MLPLGEFRVDGNIFMKSGVFLNGGYANVVAVYVQNVRLDGPRCFLAWCRNSMQWSECPISADVGNYLQLFVSSQQCFTHVLKRSPKDSRVGTALCAYNNQHRW